MQDLELTVQITKPDGRAYQWDGAGFAEDVPTGIVCTTKRQEGFSTASLTLPRRIDQDHPDIELRDELEIHSVNGDVVWEGFVTAAPRSLDDGHSIDIQATGHMAHAKNRKMVEVYVDRDISQWREPSLNERVARGVAGWAQDKDYTVSSERGLAFTGQAGTQIPANAVTSKVYRMPEGGTIAKIHYQGTQVNTSNVEAATLYTDADPDMDSAASTALTLDGTLRSATPTTAERYAELRARATATHTPGAAAPFTRTLPHLAVFGGQVATHANGTVPDTGVAGEPHGVYASEVMEHLIQTYCPKLTWAGQDSTYPIAQLAFRDLTFPYDAMLACNAFHLLDLACWENKTVYWSAVDLNDWDWEVSLEDPGFKVSLEGDSDDDSGYNGIVIQYTDLLTGEAKILWPDEHDELTDTDELNPANRHGDEHWADETLTNPCLEADALQMGRMLLAEKNQPKSPGQYTVTGFLRDRAGNWQPGWKVRAGQRIVIVDHPNRRPRLITETSWSADSHTLTLATDSAIQRVDAIVDRLTTSLTAAGLA